MLNYDKPYRIFPRILLTRNHMIFLVQFGINKHLLIFSKTKIALALRARAILLVFKKIYSCLFIPNCTRKHVITHTNKLNGGNVILPPGISQMKAFSSDPEILLKRPSFLDISARFFLPSCLESLHFEIFSCCPVCQIQTPSFLTKPMCHALVFQVPRF